VRPCPPGGGVSHGGAYSLLCVEGGQTGQRRELGAVAAYVALFCLGAMEGLIGCFQFGHSVGGLPVAALGFCALILVTIVAGAAGMGSALGGILPAIGWLAASFLLTQPTSAGSVIVTNTSAGRWYLYGGAVCAAAGVVTSFRWRLRRPGGLS
jgi:Family of unknown function (DUF6113)